MQSQRQLQVGEQVKRVVAPFLRELDFYGIDIQGISVLEVRMSSDLKQATVYTWLPKDVDVKEALVQLNELAPVIQKHIAKQVVLRFTPKIKFRADDVLDQAWKIDQLLK